MKFILNQEIIEIDEPLGNSTLDFLRSKGMKGVKEALKNLKKDGWLLKILSTRKKEKIQEYLKEHNLDQFISGVYNTKIPAQIYLDDRGIHFSNWDDALKDIKSFKKR